ncbi:MAG: IclR family transcriptional regulator, regulon repressor [Epulopiscium sp.]|jgi:DNA-binding IclR family transcriptional regulator|uniref:Glycerol operon regulatory protein n=1 Tax=Defluviitalea raffinosedens TaxID=1450156 RepID=A0A7C8LTE4_9FIRM|nr:IclR family transcriptional regulator [Defluviitalea raffinosedens]MBZ4667435.1 Transcriptional regulator IclR-like protein [Defluviitaleaceae bacterium]MDK2787562.1 IclR family transcriptional regulator, regulon repressor [Candidatus Epulonipiscium sp.]KAE9634506.1 helix-turn-helix domain-containing protein [Defluviitalea raffinosedens]MBM7684698.1 DNA-binding IclR family transcriptional regulator [Defluviitalea raffinosedens]HHW66928.1 IclR family transcriptional regulator [Candidatus Epu
MQDVVQSVDRTLSILEVLSDYEDGLGLAELSAKLDLHKSTVHRLLSTLMIKGYVEQNPVTNKYKITFKLFELGSKRLAHMDILEIAKPYLKELMEKTNEVVHLVMRENTDIIYIDKVESETTIRMHSRIGRRSPMYCTAVGKAMMAWLHEKEVVDIWSKSDIQQYTPFTITNFEDMKNELKLIKQKGFAIDNQENELEVRCIGASIFDYTGKPCAAISISGPITRMTDERIEMFSKWLIKYTSEISKELGYKM